MYNTNHEETIKESLKQKITRNNFPPNNLGNIQVTIIVESEIRPTENESYVLESLLNMFPNISFSKIKDQFLGRTNDISALNHFSQRLLDQEILDAARRVVIKGMNKIKDIDNEKGYTEFNINKQTARINKIVFCERDESPLGPIHIKIISNDIELIIDCFFPKYEWFKESSLEEIKNVEE